MNTYETTGTLKDGATLLLDQPLPITEGKVRVTVQAIAEVPAKQSLQEFLEAQQIRQAARGHIPRTREEIDAALLEERESWE